MKGGVASSTRIAWGAPWHGGSGSPGYLPGRTWIGVHTQLSRRGGSFVMAMLTAANGFLKP
jgi:hypothetical protein